MCALASSFHSGFFLVVVWLKGIPATGELISITVDAVFFFALISYLTSLFICWNIISSQENTLKCCSKIPAATKHTSMPWDISFSFFFFFIYWTCLGNLGWEKEKIMMQSHLQFSLVQTKMEKLNLMHLVPKSLHGPFMSSPGTVPKGYMDSQVVYHTEFWQSVQFILLSVLLRVWG